MSQKSFNGYTPAESLVAHGLFMFGFPNGADEQDVKILHDSLSEEQAPRIICAVVTDQGVKVSPYELVERDTPSGHVNVIWAPKAWMTPAEGKAVADTMAGAVKELSERYASLEEAKLKRIEERKAERLRKVQERAHQRAQQRAEALAKGVPISKQKSDKTGRVKALIEKARKGGQDVEQLIDKRAK